MIRIKKLWHIPVYTLVAGVVSYYLMILLNTLVLPLIVDQNTASISTVLSLVPFAVALSIGYMLFRHHSRSELFYSACLTSASLLILLVIQRLASPRNLPSEFIMIIAYFTEWSRFLDRILLSLSVPLWIISVISCFYPFIFVICGEGKSYRSQNEV